MRGPLKKIGWTLASVVFLGSPCAALSEESRCEPATLASSDDALPPAWRAALEDLVEAAAGEGQPWDCSGARISFELSGTEGELSVDLPDGRRVSRPVPSPELVKATGEALLTGVDAHPVPTDASTTKPDKPSPRPQGEPPSTGEPKPSKPLPPPETSWRLLLDAGISGRYTDSPNALWGGGTVRVTVPFGAWSGAAWVRFSLPAHIFEKVPADFAMSDVSVGLSVGRRFIEHPVEIRVSLGPALGVISEAGGYEPDFHEGSRPEIRVGADFQLTWPFLRLGRFFLANDFELSPQNFSGKRRIDPALPPLPVFSLGLSAGVGVAIP